MNRPALVIGTIYLLLSASQLPAPIVPESPTPAPEQASRPKAKRTIQPKAGPAAGQIINDPAKIEVYLTPYYNSKGPVIEVGRFSNGLAAKGESEFVATIFKMKQFWATLNFPEVYIAAIRLYDL